MIDTCSACDSKFSSTFRYNKRILTLKSLIKSWLPIIDALIPNHFGNLKQASNPKIKLFKGEIGICSKCQHGEMLTPPTINELMDYYQREYWKGRTEENKDLSSYAKNPCPVAQIELVKRHVNIKDISRTLEIGAGEAKASLYLKFISNANNLELAACEAGGQWDEHYKFHGVDRVADFFPFESKVKYDYIHSSHWLEHVLDLSETIASISRLAANDAFVFLEVPNCDSSYWAVPFPDVPHIHFFTKESLKNAFVKGGFKCLTIENAGPNIKSYVETGIIDDNQFGENPDGMWVRGLFQKT